MSAEQEQWVQQRPKFKPGQIVSMTDGVLAGITCTVGSVHAHTGTPLGLRTFPTVLYSYTLQYPNLSEIEADEGYLQLVQAAEPMSEMRHDAIKQNTFARLEEALDRLHYLERGNRPTSDLQAEMYHSLLPAVKALCNLLGIDRGDLLAEFGVSAYRNSEEQKGG